MELHFVNIIILFSTIDGCNIQTRNSQSVAGTNAYEKNTGGIINSTEGTEERKLKLI